MIGGGGNTISTTDVRLGGMRIQNTGYGVAIPILYGTNRVSPNLIEYTNFIAIPHTSTQSAGGKGLGGGGSSSNTTYTYSAAVILGICEGPVAAFGALWLDKNTYTRPSGRGLSMFSGTYPQAPWTWMQTYNPSRAIGYQGIACAASANYDLGNNASIGNHSFEVVSSGALQNGYDMNVLDVISDFLANPYYGALFPYLGDATAARNYCQANGLFISPVLAAQKPAHEWLTQFARIANAGLVWSGGTLKVIPYGDQPVTGNGATYAPNVTPIYDLTDDDFQDTGSDPVTVVRKRQADAFNSVQVEYLNRNNQYNIEPADARDQASIEAYGLRQMQSIKLHEICVPSIAKLVAQTILQRELYIRNQYQFTLSWKYFLLEPMDVVSLTDDTLGLNRTPVRIISIEENYDGLLTVVAEEMPYGVSQPAQYPHTGGAGYTPNNSVDPGSVNAPVMFEPPNVMTAPNLEVWMAVSGGANWGGCDVWVSTDNATYRNVGKILNPARHGTLIAAIAAGSDPDALHTLSVDLTACRGQLMSGTRADADNLNTLLWVDGELMSYQNATLTAQYQYGLSYLRRGAKGTPIGVHSVGAQFARLDDAIFRYKVPREMIGLPIWVKFASFNAFGNASQSLANCTAYNYTLTGNQPLGLQSLAAAGGMFLNSLSWTFPSSQYDRDYTEIYGSTSNDLNTATNVTSAKSPNTVWKHTGLTPGQTWYYWGRTVDTSGNISAWFPSSPTGGVPCTPSADPSALLTQLQNSVGMGQLASDLATPIVATSGALAAQGAAALMDALGTYSIATQAQYFAKVMSAIVTTDPATGQIQLLATANVTTAVESRLTNVEVLANATAGTLNSTVASVTAMQGNLTTAQSSIAQLQSQVSLTASQAYVNSAVNTATGALTTAAANSAQSLAQADIQAALDAFTQGQALHSATSNIALANQTISAHATAIDSLATNYAALVATVAGNGSAITAEQTARTTADTALALNINTVQARLDSGDYAAVKTQASASASAITGLQAQYVLKVDANGHVAGMTVASGGAGSSIAMLADKLVFLMPDGTGTPQQVLTVGTVNGVNALGFNGNMIIDGSVTARQINGANLAITGNGQFAGTLTAASGYFSGDISGSTGTFAGSLSAGTVDMSKLVGQTTNYLTPGTYTLTVPAGMTSMQVTLVGGGGGGGHGGVSTWLGGGGGGGGSGYLTAATFSGLAPGATYTLTVGSGGAASTAGGATAIAGLVTSLGGGAGGSSAGSNGAGGAGGAGANAGGAGGGMTLPGGSGAGSGGGAGGSSLGNAGGGGGGAGGYLTGVSASAGSRGNGPDAYGGAGGIGYGAGGGGSGGAYGTGGAGAGGMAIIEFFNPNGVVLTAQYNTLLAALTRQGIATV